MESMGKELERKEDLFNQSVEYILSRYEKGLRQVVKLIEDELDSLDTDAEFRKQTFKIKEYIRSQDEEIKELQETDLKYAEFPESNYTNLIKVYNLKVETSNGFQRMVIVAGIFKKNYEECEEKEKTEEVEKIKANLIEMWREVVHYDLKNLEEKV